LKSATTGIEKKKMAKAAVATGGGAEARKESWLKTTYDRTKGFIGDVRAELKKVSFPNLKEVRATTMVVIITVFIFGAFFYVIDGVIQFGLDRLLRAFK
jgi:preprotein translocase subunit SecE